jgi:hypothetical protein
MDSDDIIICSSFQKKIIEMEKNSVVKVFYGNGVFLKNNQLGKL